MVNGALRAFLRHARRVAGAGEGPTDRQLLDRFLAGRDEAAFELLVWRHGPVVFGVCRRVCRHEQDAEDAFQATFLALARKAGSIRRGEALGPWLCRVACRAALKARKRAPAGPLEDREGPLATPDGEAERSDLWSLVDEEIDRLPEKYRTALVACYLEGNTHAEAARLLGCPKGTVAVRLMRARKRLRDRLARRGVALGVAAPVLPELAPAHVPANLTRLAAGTAVGKASGPVTALAEGVMKTLAFGKVKWTAVVLALVLLGGVGTFLGRAPAGGGGEEARESPGAGRRADPDLVKVPSPQAGILVAVGEKGRPLRVGDRVKEGQVLARLDDRLARIERGRARLRVEGAEAEVRSVQASVQEAKTRYERIEGLNKKKLVSEEEVRRRS
jgi:HlyD family secretion protein